MTLSTKIKVLLPPKLVNLAFLEGTVVFSAVFIGLFLQQGHFDKSILANLTQLGFIALLYSSITLAIMLSFGLYNRLILVRKAERIPRLLLSILATFFVFAEISYVWPSIDLGRGAWLVIDTVTFLSLFIVRLLLVNILGETSFKKRVLVLGAGRKALQFAQSVGKETEGAKILGYVHQPGERELLDKSQVLYSIQSLCDYAKTEHIDEIVVAVDDRRNKFPLKQLLNCRLNGIDVTDLLYFYERECGQIKLDILDPSWLIFAQGFKRRLFHENIKRIFDLTATSLLLIALAPVFLFALALLVMQNGIKSSVWQRIPSLGQQGNLFDRLVFAVDTKPGLANAIIRKLNVVELPQLLNVLRGEMSLIGPVADEKVQSQVLRESIPYYNERHMVKPGVTGWAQMIMTKGQLNQDKQQRLQYDLYYVKNNSLFLDLVILLTIIPQCFVKHDKKNLLEKSILNSSGVINS